MGLRKRLLLLAASFIALNAVLWAIMHFAPVVPEPYKGAAVAPTAPTVFGSTTATSTPPPLPPGFPSMERPPPKIKVPDGQPQPIATKFGLTYDVPADWRNFSTGIVSWTTNGRSVTYGAVADFGYKHCPETDGSTLAESGMSGRNGVDIHTAALDAARQAEVVFGDSADFAPPKLAYSDPIEFDIDGERAVRYTVQAEGIHQRHDCDPVNATFDIVATAGFATAPVAVFMIQLDQNLNGSLEHSVADQVISTIRRSDTESGA